MKIARILVVDDEVGVCEGIKRALASTDYQVDITTSSEDGLKMVREGSYDLLLLDVMMPGASGIDLLASIHAHDPELVCIIITGYATVELAVSAIKHGAYDFLTKPFSVDELTLAVEQGLERRRLSLEAKRTAAAESEAKRLAEEKSRLEELDQAKRQFIRLITHELQSPIDAIQSYLNLIRDGYISPSQLPEIIEKCSARIEDERALIMDLLELGKLETLPTQQTAVPVQMDAVLRDILDEIQPRAESRMVAIRSHIEPGLPPVQIDPVQTKSLWRNLLDNAIKYTPKNGSVTISLCAKEGAICGQVTDTGIGIAQEDHDRLFTEFFRARNAKESGVRGTGLGLVIVRRIVEGLGGKVSVSSKLGEGSTFSFEIPVSVESMKL